MTVWRRLEELVPLCPTTPRWRSLLLWSPLDALGVMVLDENRVFAIGLGHNMVDLVQRDR